MWRTVYEFLHGHTAARWDVTAEPVCRLLDIPFARIARAEADDLADLLARFRGHAAALRDIWYGTEAEIAAAAREYHAIAADVAAARGLVGELGRRDLPLVGGVAGVLVGCAWVFDGRGGRAVKATAQEVAAACAGAAEARWHDAADADRVLGIRYHNATGPGMDAWLAPGRRLAAAEVENAVKTYRRAGGYFADAVDGPGTAVREYGPDGTQTLGQFVNCARVLTDGDQGGWREAERLLAEVAERRQPADAITAAELAVAAGQLAARRGHHRRAVRELRSARRLFEAALGASDHHLVAACTLRLDQLGDDQARGGVLGRALDTLAASAVRFSSIVDRKEVAREYAHRARRLHRRAAPYR